jgi:hypothetical protein
MPKQVAKNPATPKHAAGERTREDVWAYTPEILERHRRARLQPTYVLGPDDLEQIAREAEVAHAAGQEYQVSEAELEAMEARHLTARKGQAPDR